MHPIARNTSAEWIRCAVAFATVGILLGIVSGTSTRAAAADWASATPTAVAAATGYSNLRVPGSTFRPRSSATKYAYAGTGCVQTISGTDLFVHPIHLPQGAIVRSVRAYYFDASTGNDLTLYLTEYDGAGAAVDLTTATSSGSGGYGTGSSPALSYVVDDFSNSLQLLASVPVATGSALRFCGARVNYDIGNDGIFKNGFEP